MIDSINNELDRSSGLQRSHAPTYMSLNKYDRCDLQNNKYVS